MKHLFTLVFVQNIIMTHIYYSMYKKYEVPPHATMSPQKYFKIQFGNSSADIFLSYTMNEWKNHKMISNNL